jgi:hypothetical protein
MNSPLARTRLNSIYRHQCDSGDRLHQPSVCVAGVAGARAGDCLFEKMVTSIRTDEARHAQIGHPVLTLVMKHDPGYAQYLTGTPRSAILCSPW